MKKDMTKEDNYQEYVDITSEPVYRLLGADVIGVANGEGYKLSHKQMQEVVDYFKQKFEIEDWSEYVKLTLQTYYEHNPQKDENGKNIEF